MTVTVAVPVARPSTIVVAALLLAGCPARYDAPPEIAAINLERGLYDPARGPLRVELSEPAQPSTLEIALRLSRRDLEGELCPEGAGAALPRGCTETARVLFGPCRLDATKATRDGDRARYACPGGALLADAEARVFELDFETRLTPYERYTLLIGPGLSDGTGHVRRRSIGVDFEVAGEVPRAPTDFRTGTFFAVLETMEPVAAQFHFFFYLKVRPDTGEFLVVGADADARDPATDLKTNRDPLAWIADPDPTTGSVVRTLGQVAGPPESRALIVHPFRLLVPVPPVDAPDVELRGAVRLADAGTPPRARETVEGGMFASEIFLGVSGERANLGSGRGTLKMFRLDPEESPPFDALLPPGITRAQALAGFED